jgi:hypothetical protein
VQIGSSIFASIPELYSSELNYWSEKFFFFYDLAFHHTILINRFQHVFFQIWRMKILFHNLSFHLISLSQILHIQFIYYLQNKQLIFFFSSFSDDSKYSNSNTKISSFIYSSSIIH